MARAWLVDGKSIAKKVKNPIRSSEELINDNGVQLECPYCRFYINNSDVECEWPGLPLGVKFDPTDVELLDHLSAKCGVGCSKPHPFIDEFIPTIEDEAGICYSHPENLPGVKKDGTAIHFFHKTTNAYATGRRKRRRVHSDGSSSYGGVRWHKTGKTKPVLDDNGVHKGFKKIMVLLKTDKQEGKEKSKWVVHQYHLGADKDEDGSHFVVSKVFFQKLKDDEQICDPRTARNFNGFFYEPLPRTPNRNTPNPPWHGKSLFEADRFGFSIIEELKGESDELNFLESQTMDLRDLGEEDPLLCTELLEKTVTGEANNAPCNISELENLDFDLEDYFGPLESVLNVYVRL